MFFRTDGHVSRNMVKIKYRNNLEVIPVTKSKLGEKVFYTLLSVVRWSLSFPVFRQSTCPTSKL